MSRALAWCFTLHNWTENEWDVLKQMIESKCKCGIMGKEICPTTGTPHIQGYFKRNEGFAISAGGIKKLNKRMNYRLADGSAQSNYVYCSKEGNFWAHGDFGDSQQGKRTDLIRLKDEIMEGKKVDEIALEKPNMYHMYGRTLNKIEDLRMRKLFRTEMTRGRWLWGATGVGKSHAAFENYHPDTHYVVNCKDAARGWWDGYTQQDTVIINEFRGQITFSELLDLVDKWPCSVSRRNREPLPFISKLVIITSSLHPHEVYSGVCTQAENIAQLDRRFEIIEMVRTE